MKTILVIYTDEPLTQKEIVENYGNKRYVFNTEADLQIGDMLTSPKYETPMQVVEVCATAYSLFNRKTGELSNHRSSTEQFEIRKLIVVDAPEPNVVFATKLQCNSYHFVEKL